MRVRPPFFFFSTGLSMLSRTILTKSDLSEADKQSEHYRKGVSCHQCIDEFSDEKRARFAERQRQVELAVKRGREHIAQDIATARAEAEARAEEARAQSLGVADTRKET